MTLPNQNLLVISANRWFRKSFGQYTKLAYAGAEIGEQSDYDSIPKYALSTSQQPGDMKLWAMAELFNAGSESAVSRSVTRINDQLAAGEMIRFVYKSILQDLTP